MVRCWHIRVRPWMTHGSSEGKSAPRCSPLPPISSPWICRPQMITCHNPADNLKSSIDFQETKTDQRTRLIKRVKTLRQSTCYLKITEFCCRCSFILSVGLLSGRGSSVLAECDNLMRVVSQLPSPLNRCMTSTTSEQKEWLDTWNNTSVVRIGKKCLPW